MAVCGRGMWLWLNAIVYMLFKKPILEIFTQKTKPASSVIDTRVILMIRTGRFENQHKQLHNPPMNAQNFPYTSMNVLLYLWNLLIVVMYLHYAVIYLRTNRIQDIQW